MISQCELPIPALKRSSAEPHAAWDRFVERCPGGDLVQTTAWATTKRGVGLQTSLTTAHGPDGEIVGGGLVIVKEVLTGVRLGYVPRGPLLNGDSDSAVTVVDGLISSARSKGVQLLIIQPPLGGEACESALAARGFEPGCPGVAPEATIRL